MSTMTASASQSPAKQPPMKQWTYDHVPRLDGKTLVVTGANSGIGFEAARVFAKAGATVILACRSRDKTEQAIARIREESPDAAVHFGALDLASLASVRSFATEFSARHPHLDALVNNAGVMALPRRETADGFEMQIGTNHLGHFALTALLWPRLAATPSARVVNVASLAYRPGKIRIDDLSWKSGYSKWPAYCQSKLANLLFTLELDRRVKARASDVKVAACHPGYSATNLQYVGPEMESSGLGKRIMRLGNSLFAQSAEMGALPTVYATVGGEVEGNDFIGPDGFMGMTGDHPAKTPRKRHALDEDVAAKLWTLSEELTGVRFDP
jgi:NAD(P)-dependent dehydrogenase (short-subunit alcohol dehydrogenase family)